MSFAPTCKYSILTFFGMLVINLSAFGQRQANTWYFGNGVGLTFNNDCSPNVLTDGAIDGWEGCTTISDEITGELLFYTNSENVWNRNHDSIPGAYLVPGGHTITQCVVVKKPLSDSLYYIVTAEIQGSGDGLRFHCIDMSLNGGLGGIAYKDSLLFSSPVTEKLTAVRHANGIDIWIIAHEYNSDKFLCFLLTQNGVHLTPTISAIGKIHADDQTLDALGEVKASPDSKKLASVTYYHPNVELFDFNNATGIISNLITLPELGAYNGAYRMSGLYGLSFSSNSQMLYASSYCLPEYSLAGKIIQYDISSNNATQIQNSRVNLFSSNSSSCLSLKLAPDRKIYVAHDRTNYIGAINFPDQPGFSAQYVDSALYLEGKVCSWGLNNLMESSDYCAFLGIGENNLNSTVKLYPNPAAHHITIEFSEIVPSEMVLTVYDIHGQMVRTIMDLPSNNLEIDIENLEEGLYLFNLQSKQKLTGTGKFVVQR